MAATTRGEDAVSKQSSSSLGGLAGSAFGLVVTLGIIGAPLYLAYLQADQRALDAAVDDNVESVRRTVLHLDERIGVMADAYAALGDEAKPQDPKAPGFRAKLDAQLAKNDELLKEAKDNVRALRDVRRGGVLGGAHLSVRRIGAIFSLATGKIHNNRAAIEDQFASVLRRQAAERVDSLAAFERGVKLAGLRKPTAGLAKLQSREAELDASIQELEAEASRQRSLLAARKTTLAAADAAARDARRQLAALDQDTLTPSQYQTAYMATASNARKAEAQAMALQNGSLDNADSFLDATNEGGEITIGIRDLGFQLARLEQQIAARQQMKAANSEQQAALRDRQNGLDDLQRHASNAGAALNTELQDLLREADRHTAVADAARDKALAAFDRAAQEIAKAIHAASDGRRKAGDSLRELGDATDECLTHLSRDQDTEGGLHCLAANIAYEHALTLLCRNNALQAKQQTQAFFAKMLGEEPPRVEELAAERRAAADEQLNAAVSSYAKARDMIRATNLKAADGTTISGANLLWQIDVGTASVRLLQANLADNPGQRTTALDEAHQLLQTAAEDREQSPLLTPAVETIQYLQRTAAAR